MNQVFVGLVKSHPAAMDPANLTMAEQSSRLEYDASSSKAASHPSSYLKEVRRHFESRRKAPKTELTKR